MTLLKIAPGIPKGGSVRPSAFKQIKQMEILLKPVPVRFFRAFPFKRGASKLVIRVLKHIKFTSYNLGNVGKGRHPIPYKDYFLIFIGCIHKTNSKRGAIKSQGDPSHPITRRDASVHNIGDPIRVKEKRNSTLPFRVISENLKSILPNRVKSSFKGETNNFDLLQHHRVNVYMTVHKPFNNKLAIWRLKASNIPGNKLHEEL